MLKRHRLRFVHSASLSPVVRSLVFEVAGSTLLDYVPGQFIDLFVPSQHGLPAKRSYSIASAPGCAGPRHIELALTRVPGGAASAYLHELEEGAVLEAGGPRGSLRCWPEEQDEPALFVAAGSGLAPLRAMLQEELLRGQGPPVALLFGCRSRPDVLWGAELQEWANQHSRFRLDVTLSCPDAGWAGWAGRTGYVQAHVAELVARFRPRRGYVCGLSAMVHSAVEALRAAAIAGGAIRYELFDA